MTEDTIEMQARLIFDSWTEPGPELRADAPEDRHLIYEGGGIILDLLLKNADNGGACLHIGGQVLPEEQSLETVSNLKVSIEQGDNRSITRTNALGEFTFHAVPNRTLDLSITLNSRRFQVRGLSNRQPREWKVVPSLAGGGD